MLAKADILIVGLQVKERRPHREALNHIDQGRAPSYTERNS